MKSLRDSQCVSERGNQERLAALAPARSAEGQGRLKALVILGGLTTSTLMNLFVLPALYRRFGRVASTQTG